MCLILANLASAIDPGSYASPSLELKGHLSRELALIGPLALGCVCDWSCDRWVVVGSISQTLVQQWVCGRERSLSSLGWI